MNIKTVYFDMDGVLVDFDQSLMDKTGLSFQEIANIRNDVQKNNRGISNKDNTNQLNDPILDLIHHHIDYGVFETAPPMKEFDIFNDIIDCLQNNNIEVAVLSSVASKRFASKAIQQKQNWLEKYNIDCKQYYTLGSEKKKDFATSQTLLIDDLYKNIKGFKNNGGNSIHHCDIGLTFKLLKETFPFIKLNKSQTLFNELTQDTIYSFDNKMSNKENIKVKPR